MKQKIKEVRFTWVRIIVFFLGGGGGSLELVSNSCQIPVPSCSITLHSTTGYQCYNVTSLAFLHGGFSNGSSNTLYDINVIFLDKSWLFYQCFSTPTPPTPAHDDKTPFYDFLLFALLSFGFFGPFFDPSITQSN